MVIMPTPAKRTAPIVLHRGSSVYVCPPRLRDADAFLAAVHRSRRLHGAWVRAPRTNAAFREYVARFGARAQRNPRAAKNAGVLIRKMGDDAIVGVFNLSEIVRGSFHSAYLGYYAFTPYAGTGQMADGLALALAFAFRTLHLHRVEVNVQPRNVRSHALVQAAGFVREGFSRRYLRIAGRWRDHVRYALLAEDWRAQRKQLR
jgi:[ribosomal protein S5]-alanine N-acetyltransferase